MKLKRFLSITAMVAVAASAAGAATANASISIIPGTVLMAKYFQKVRQRANSVDGEAPCAPRPTQFKLTTRDRYGFEVQVRKAPVTRCGMLLKVGGAPIPGEYWGYNIETGTIGILHEGRVYVGDVLELQSTWQRRR